MDLSFSEEQEMLRKAAREFLEAESPKSHVREMEADERGFSPELWRKMAALGWLGLPFPEYYGGGAGSFLDLTVILEELGRALTPVPFLSTVVLGGYAIAEFGTEPQKQAFLPAIARGERILTLALTEASARYTADALSTTATFLGNRFVLNGTKLFVHHAHVADTLLVIAKSEEAVAEEALSVFVVDTAAEGLAIRLLKTMASDRQCEVTLKDVSIPADALLGKRGEGWAIVDRLLQLGTVAECARMSGGAQQLLDLTVEYAKTRVQFGKPIGSFQAIQHHCANMAIDVDGIRYMTYEAAWRLSEELPAALEVAMAKGWSSDAYARVAKIAHQVHGGIGVIKDYDVQLYSRRAKGSELLFGDSDFHRERVAQLLRAER